MMMNFRRIAAGSLHLLQKSATRPALFPKPSDSGVIARLRWTTRALSTTESAETAAAASVFSSKDNLMSRVNRLHKEGKDELALHLFDSMDANKVEFTPSEFAFHIEILAKVKGLAAAKAYFKKADPDFNDGDIHAKNWPAYATLLRLTSEELDQLANHLHPLRISFSRIAELVSPSVVYVYGTRGEGDGYVLSSGFFIDEKTIITSSRDILDGQKLFAVLRDGTQLDGKLVKISESLELALVRVDTKDLQPGCYGTANLGFSNRVRTGEWVGALGAPLGLRNTLTVGIISCPNRCDHEIGWENQGRQFLQFDCLIHESSFGGPLVGLDGLVVGVIMMGYGPAWMDRSLGRHANLIGIAVPIDTVRDVLLVD
ncbi:unnamed protein product [Arabidopsis lyrata]|uniref:Trypsin family protein n=1 Tax=Arabidopsis lyrata subsp. lyrata TaxID=81972 RepID=D7KP88_ARALL|nr:putative protease Do-like 14 [Arabidopsis lyrata subsp. lyrata]EFH66203.1 hypothetical protein ARALYDRAFT_334551 [Arabidopsis lyrata subsp. lyrata]CAH8252078.1 unnamed protein product [Arabidopsis lyrata]|eukprot:XP_002889944.1 putative protease Do-like 14 [Arabidopsis lyrata subsp. lyrata]